MAEDSLSPEQRAERGSYAGCIAGALSVSEFREGLQAVGLTDVTITPSHTVTDGMISAIIKATKPADARPLIDLSAPRDAAGRRGRLLRRRRLLLMQTKRAAAGDWPAVRDLLTEAGLPLDGAAEAFATGVVASDGDRLVGCAAIEPYDGPPAALGRRRARSTRDGRRDEPRPCVEDWPDGGATSLILLTETAEPWFSASATR